jgi:hypothetical protein
MQGKFSFILIIVFCLLSTSSIAQVASNIEIQNLEAEADYDMLDDTVFSHYLCNYDIQNSGNDTVEASIHIPVGYYLNCDTRNDFVQDSTYTVIVMLQPNKLTHGIARITIKKYSPSNPQKCDALKPYAYSTTYKVLPAK